MKGVMKTKVDDCQVGSCISGLWLAGPLHLHLSGKRSAWALTYQYVESTVTHFLLWEIAFSLDVKNYHFERE